MDYPHVWINDLCLVYNTGAYYDKHLQISLHKIFL
jgi:hypothetical protein